MSDKQVHNEPRGAISWMAGNSVAANLLMAVLLVGGLLIGLNIKQEVFPDFDMDMVKVSVAYPGASPEEVEQGIVLPVEEAIQGLEGVKEVTSVASEGSGSITVEAIEGAGRHPALAGDEKRGRPHRHLPRGGQGAFGVHCGPQA